MSRRLVLTLMTCCVACGDSTTNGNPDGGGNDTSTVCPDEGGKYTIAVSGAGCGVISTASPICITQIAACTISMTTGSSGSNAVSGQVDIGNDGSMSNATVQEGATTRTGCVSTWDDATSTMTIDCGGVATSQSCRVTLTRIAPACN